MTERGNFGTKIGVILATAGSAVGLGNIWRFPYMTGQDGGAAFIVIYIVCVLMLGIPGMVAEFIVGRHGASNAMRAYGRVGGKPWAFLGVLGALTALIILGFYSVIAGWCLQYLFASMMGQMKGDPQYIQKYFTEFTTGTWTPIIWSVVFILITHLVVIRGVRRGIEKFSNVLMPLLFILLIVIVIASCTLSGAMDGIRFLFHPDFSKINRSVFLDALGQSFFSLSLGTACLCTYSSYFSRRTKLLNSAAQIAGLDSLIAILAGLMIFPAAFSVGVQPDSGPSLIFITLPNVFQQAFTPTIGYLIAILFYALLALAALTSTISMHEIGTALFYEELHISRRHGAIIETCLACIIGVLCSLSCGAVDLTIFDKSFLDFCDYLTSNVLLVGGSFLTCILVGWLVPLQTVKDEFTNWGTISGRLFVVWLFVIRFVSPLCILAVFLHQLGIV